MRSILVTSHCSKQAFKSSSDVLDRYIWRSSDKTWSGHVSNGALEALTRDLKKQADRGIHIEAFEQSENGAEPLFAIKPANRQVRPTAQQNANIETLRAIVGVAAFFHDFGKATQVFQKKLTLALRGDETPEAFGDPVRHEIFSTYVCDTLFGSIKDRAILKHLLALTPEDMDAAAVTAATRCAKLYHAHLASSAGNVDLELSYVAGKKNKVARAICDLVLTHHRLPSCLERFDGYGSRNHVTIIEDLEVTQASFALSEGTPFWHEETHLSRLKRFARSIDPKSDFSGVLAHHGRTALMFADHLGSADKQVSIETPSHMANTVRERRRVMPGDSLSEHVHKVQKRSRSTGFAICNATHALPALTTVSAPADIINPPHAVPEAFTWQKSAADAAAKISSSSEGGFFACLLAGTGTGKTRAAPTILSAAAFQDANPNRRQLRFVLGLGLRSLASQSSKEYIEDLGFPESSVATMIGVPPIEFEQDVDQDSDDLTDWFDIESGVAFDQGSREERNWLRSLSQETPGQRLPILDDIIENSGRNATKLRKLIEAPILCATVDHIAPVASPVRSRHLGPALRMLTSDLILDEVDQYGAEDLAALTRLVYHVGLSGGRCIIMSATLPQDLAEAMFNAYRAGWKAYAKFHKLPGFVNALIAADQPGAIYARTKVSRIDKMFAACAKTICKGLKNVFPKRRAIMMSDIETWSDVVDQTHEMCNRMHEDHAHEIEGFRVSAGLIKMTRITHTTAMAAQLPIGSSKYVLRKKICLHSKFPRISRAWIEDQMRSALRRKGDDGNAGLRRLCEEMGLFEEARASGVSEIQLIFITSPVVETGNDIDFDYAILDPLDLRSLIQAAGRVLRHRDIQQSTPNIAIFPKSIVALETGRVSLPGVETPLAKATFVSQIKFSSMRELQDCADPRSVAALMGDHALDVIDARLVLQQELNTPWRIADKTLRQRFIIDGYTVGMMLKYPCLQFSTALPLARKFRRSDAEEAELTLVGRAPSLWQWQIDPQPGTWPHQRWVNPRLRWGGRHEGFLFNNILETALRAKCGRAEDLPEEDLLRYSSVKIRNPLKDVRDDVDIPNMVIFDQLGALNGEVEVVFAAFGKT